MVLTRPDDSGRSLSLEHVECCSVVCERKEALGECARALFSSHWINP